MLSPVNHQILKIIDTRVFCVVCLIATFRGTNPSFSILFACCILDLGGFDYDTSKVAEFEFYLLEELEFYLIVYHPYRDLTLIAKDLKLEESNLQTAW